MMRITQSFKQYAAAGIVGLFGVGLAACDDLLTESPPHVLTAENLYSDVAGFEAGLAALYVQVRTEMYGFKGLNRPGFMLMRAGVDNAYGGNDDLVRTVVELGPYAISTNEWLFATWEWLYSTINAANTLINRAENPDLRWTEAKKNQVVAEARLIRAWAYRHAAYLWGDVPISLKESTGSNIKTDWERAPLAEVQKQIEADLLFAEQHLPLVPKTDGKVSKAVAQHYLSELYLWMGQPARAEEKAEAVLNSGAYRLITRRYGVRANQPGSAFMDQFYDGNVLRGQGDTEVLWALEFEQNVPGGGENNLRRTWASSYHQIAGLALSAEHGGRGQRRGIPTQWAVNIYCFGDTNPAACLDQSNPKSRTPDDVRGNKFALRRFYIYNNQKGLPKGVQLGDTLWLKVQPEDPEIHTQITTRKWDWADPNNVRGDASYGDVPYIRLAETYLLAAEAELKQGKLSEAAAHINALRRRANAQEITPGQVTLDFILDERSRELLTEEQRRYTLLRTGKLAERVRLYNPYTGPKFMAHHVLLPIPQAVIDANLSRELRQNPGY